MIRNLLVIAFFLIVYHSLKTVFRSARRAYHEEDPRPGLMGEEMVLDPQCRTYVVKDRSVTRRIGGASRFFCSEACARQYEEKMRS
jgi:YHS domain-containing protein